MELILTLFGLQIFVVFMSITLYVFNHGLTGNVINFIQFSYIIVIYNKWRVIIIADYIINSFIFCYYLVNKIHYNLYKIS